MTGNRSVSIHYAELVSLSMDVHEPEVRSYNMSQIKTNRIIVIKTKIGIRTKELRMNKGLTQEEVAWKADVDRTSMNHVENSKRNVSVDTLEKIICNGLECSFRDFFNSDLFSSTNKS